MNEPIPPIRLRTDQHRLVGRDGLVLCFFIRRSHGEIAPAIWRALRTYVQAIPPGVLAWYGDYDGNTLPLDPTGWAFVQEELLGCASPATARVELWENESEVGGYNFEYLGRWLDAPPFDQDTDATCGVCFSFPSEYLQGQGAHALRMLALELARELPFSFGYASPAIVSPGGRWYMARQALIPLLERYLGLDLYRLEETSRAIGARARGAHWLTFLGPELVNALGGLHRLHEALPSPRVSFRELEQGRLLLTLGDEPDALDTRKHEDAPHYRALARLLEPFFLDEHTGWFSLDKEPMRRWLRRLCT